MKRQWISLAVIGALTMGILAGCSPSTPETAAAGQPAGETRTAESSGETIVVWAWDPNFNIDIMKHAASRYQADHPDVEFDIVELAKADVEQKLHTSLASGTTAGLPDIVLIEDYNAQKYLQSYPGSFADLSGDFDFTRFAPYKVELMTLAGNVYGVPFDSGVAVICYRSDLLAEAGYDAEDMKEITWDRFIEIGKDVKEKTGKAFLAFDKSDGGMMRIMLQSAGNWYFNPDGSVNVAGNEALKEAMEVYKKVVEADIAIPTSGWNDWVSAFNSSNCASVTSGAWIIGSVKAAADQSGLWAVAPAPRLSTVSSVNASNLGGSSWYILEASPKKAAAIKFMQDIYAGDIEFYQDILVKNGAVATYMPAYEGAAYAAADEFFGGQKIFKDITEYINKIPAVNYGIHTYEADAAVMGQMAEYLSGKTLEDALKDAEAQLNNQMQ